MQYHIYQIVCVSLYVFRHYLIFWKPYKTPIQISTPGRWFVMWQSCFYKRITKYWLYELFMGKNISSLMSITMLELCSYGQKRQLYSINIEHCPRENDTPFHRNLWLTCYHDLRTGVLFQAVWLIHILKRFIN